MVNKVLIYIYIFLNSLFKLFALHFLIEREPSIKEMVENNIMKYLVPRGIRYFEILII